MEFEEDLKGVAARICQWMVLNNLIGGRKPKYLPTPNVLKYSLRPQELGLGNKALKWLMKMKFVLNYRKDLIYLNSIKMKNIGRFIEENLPFY